MTESIVAHFKRDQVLQEQAAHLGLHGTAIVSRHESINARMQRGAEHILQLLQMGRQEQAMQLLSTGDWCMSEKGERCG